MPLQNRVDPFGDLLATPARGLLFGNRGGRFHRDDRTLGSRRHASRQWICCVLDFKDRQRDVWGRSYTELFFLDEVTAFAAGHRPCFECRRKDAQAFAAAFPKGSPAHVPKKWEPVFRRGHAQTQAPAMDRVLHAERLDGRTKRTHRGALKGLPDGVCVAQGGEAFAVRQGRLLRWTPGGYDAPRTGPQSGMVDVLTPPAIVAVLAAGYRPLWHPSAE